MTPTVTRVLLAVILTTASFSMEIHGETLCKPAFKYKEYGQKAWESPLITGAHCIQSNGTYYFTNKRITT